MATKSPDFRTLVVVEQLLLLCVLCSVVAFVMFGLLLLKLFWNIYSGFCLKDNTAKYEHQITNRNQIFIFI